MTIREVREYLNEFLPPIKKYNRSIANDSKLSTSDIAILCDYVYKFDSKDEKFDWKGTELDKVTDVIKRFKEKYDRKGIPVAMPFLIKQVLFYLALACYFNKNDNSPLAVQRNILEELNKRGVELSHNFFTRLNVTSYINTIEYNQPKLPFGYAGQKIDEMGVAIKHLVYQAGAYNVFVDVFGGSGAASVAFPRRKNSIYVYNDLDEDLANYIDVISDYRLHKVLIDMIEQLQTSLRSGMEVRDFNIIDFKQEVTDYLNSIRKVRGNVNKERIEKNNEVKSVSDIDIYDIISWMLSIYKELTNEENKLLYKDSEEFLNKYFADYIKTQNIYSLLLSYFLNFENIYSYVRENFVKTNNCISVKYYTDDKRDTRELNLHEHYANASQLRFFEWYATFTNFIRFRKSNPKRNKVLLQGVDSVYDVSANEIEKAFYALAVIYINFITIRNKVRPSPVYLMYRDVNEFYSNGKNIEENTTCDKFVNTDFSDIIGKLHLILNKKEKNVDKKSRALAKKTIVESLDCIDVINKYRSGGYDTDVKHTNPLLYLDSPYIETEHYAVNKNDAGSAFTVESMKELIHTLGISNDKFIFSCRACKSTEKKEDEKDTKKSGNKKRLKKSDDIIYDAVFGEFKKTFDSKKLYVLTIDKKRKKYKDGVKPSTDEIIEFCNNIDNFKNKKDINSTYSFWENVINHKIAEVMITNYEITSFKDKYYPNCAFVVYKFDDFIKILTSIA